METLREPKKRKPVDRTTIVRHELTESYERTDNKKDWENAHKAANKKGNWNGKAKDVK